MDRPGHDSTKLGGVPPKPMVKSNRTGLNVVAKASNAPGLLIAGVQTIALPDGVSVVTLTMAVFVPSLTRTASPTWKLVKSARRALVAASGAAVPRVAGPAAGAQTRDAVAAGDWRIVKALANLGTPPGDGSNSRLS